MKKRRLSRSYGAIPLARPVEKKVIFSHATGTSTATTWTDLYTCTFPCTLQNLRWDIIVYHNSAVAAYQRTGWVVVVEPDGTTPGSIIMANGSDFYNQTESFVLAHGLEGTAWNDTAPELESAQGPTVVNSEGTSKTSRRLKPGDKVRMGWASSTVLGSLNSATVQFFIKA